MLNVHWDILSWRQISFIFINSLYFFFQVNSRGNKQIVYVNYLANKSNRSKSVELILNNTTKKLIDLNLNSDLINQNAVIHYSNLSISLDELIRIQDDKKLCLFYGQIRNELNSLAALSICNGLVF